MMIKSVGHGHKDATLYESAVAASGSTERRLGRQPLEKGKFLRVM